MGARQSKRSVDITTTPKKGEGEAVVSEDKIEKLGDADVAEVVTNGTAAHKDIEYADKDETKETEEKPATEVKENGLPETSDGEKTPDKEEATAAPPAAGDQPAKTPEAAASEQTAENGGEKAAAETPDAKKQKEKKKKKWSLRSISFSKKDKSKPGKDKEKNGEVEEVNEEKEEASTKASTETTNSEDTKTTAEVAKDVTTAEETTKSPEAEDPSSTKEDSTPKVEPKAEEVVHQTETTPSSDASKEQPVKEEPALSEPNVKPEEKEDVPQEVAAPVSPVAEEVKEVRNDDVPPPLPNSNPPSQVAVFAESLKDDPVLIESNIVVNSPVSESLLNQCETTDVSEAKKEEHVDVESVKESVEVCDAEKESEHPKSPLELEAEVKSVDEISKTEELMSCTNKDSSLVNEQEIEPVEKKESSELDVTSISPSDNTNLSEESNEEIAQNSDLSSVAQINLNEQLETSDLADSKPEEITSITEIQDSDSNISIPAVAEEKIPPVSSAGDAPNVNESESSMACDESESDLGLVESAQETQLRSEEQESVESEETNLIAQSESSINVENDQNEAKNVESTPSSPPKEVEQLCNADSLADLSTESLPSLPEPTDSVLEPMSLPPLDSVPDPLPDDSVPSPVTEVVALTNGSATNGTSPSADTPPPTPLDGPLKQVADLKADAEEMSQSIGANADSLVVSVKSEAQ